MHPVIFTIPTPWGDLPIYSYGVMLGTSLIIAWYLIMWLGVKKEDLRRDWMANGFIVTAVTAIIGSRILYIATNMHEFDGPLDWFKFRTGGLVAYGGFIGGFAGALWYWRRKGVELLAWADLVAPTLGTGLLFTRIGCYLYGCDFGKPLEASAPEWLRDWGTFPKWALDHLDIHGSPAWSHHIERMRAGLDDLYPISETARYSLPVHPTQLYESAIGAVLFVVGMFIWSRRQFRGQVVLIIAALYAIWRFFVEMLRDDPERGAALGFSTSQIISLALLPIAGYAYVFFYKRHKERGGDDPIPVQARESTHMKELAKKDEPADSSSEPVKKKKIRKGKNR